ncbi:MAG TPA: outer membrane beta-barrel protein [Alphaproteobacteria bacterium]|nr:outer membrane beta-barrel protein [Alphaproteobacteria bacterium]
MAEESPRVQDAAAAVQTPENGNAGRGVQLAFHDAEVPEGHDAELRARKEARRVGSFLVHLNFAVAESYDDNIFATRNNPASDFITIVAPRIHAVSDWGRHELKFQGSSHLAYYKHHGGEDYQDFNLQTKGRYDLDGGGNLFGGVWFGRDHEDRESPDDVFGAEPITYYDLRTFGGYSESFGRFFLRAGGRFDKLDFNDVKAAGGGEINEDDRDRTVVTGGARAGYRLNSVITPFLQAGIDRRGYLHTPDDNGFDRDSLGYRIIAGTEAAFASNLHGEVFAGYLRQDYDSRALPDVEGPAFGGQLHWSASPETSVRFFVDRTVDETTIGGASAALNTSGGARVRHDFSERFYAVLRAAHGVREFEGIDRDDRLTTTAALLAYEFTEQLALKAEYHFEHMRSSAGSQDFDVNHVFVGLESYF